MDNFLIYGIGALLACFTVATYLLARVDTETISEDYEFQLDPFWYLFGVMFIGGVVSFSIFPQSSDTVVNYSYFNVITPFVFAGILYFCCLLDIAWLINLVTFIFALIMSYTVPESFQLFPEQLEIWQDRLVVALLLFTISRGLGLLNGLGGIASMQFIAVMGLSGILVYFGAMPQILGVLALAYLGSMLAFAFFSWPPEKLIISDGGFSCFGFILGCFMLCGAFEFVEAPMFVVCSYLFTEVGLFLYKRFVEQQKAERSFMLTSYFQISREGAFEKEIVWGVGKILLINMVLAIIQIFSDERLAFPVFAVALNLWFLSILSGDTNPEELLSISKWGKNAIKGVLTKNKKKKDSQKK